MKRLILILALGSAAATSFAQAPAARCGGVGDDEQKAMKAEAAQHDMMLTFSVTGGAYLADVDVNISNGKGVALQHRCKGPLMLVDLPGKGSYTVTATANGKTQKKNVSVGAKGTNISFVWPAS